MSAKVFMWCISYERDILANPSRLAHSAGCLAGLYLA